MGAEMRDQDNVPSRRWVIVAAAGLSLAMGGFINVVAFSQQGSTPPPAGPGGGAPQTATPGREQGAAPVQPAGAGRGGRAAVQSGPRSADPTARPGDTQTPPSILAHGGASTSQIARNRRL